MACWCGSAAVSSPIDALPSQGCCGVLVAHGDQGGGYSLEYRDEQLTFVHNDGHGATTVANFGAVGGGRHLIDLTLGAPGGGRWVVSVSVDGQPRGADDRTADVVAVGAFTGIDIGIDSKSPVDWHRAAKHGSYRFSGTVHSVRYTPGEYAPDAGARFVELTKQIGSRVRVINSSVRAPR